MSDYSVVEFMPEHAGYSCGYCKSSNSNFSTGMWGHRLLVEDYFELLERGWRRSGLYLYKPTMDKTCCPLYPIKCEVKDLKLSKSQKKVIKEVNRFLKEGTKKERKKGSQSEESTTTPTPGDSSVKEMPDLEFRTMNSKRNSEEVVMLEDLTRGGEQAECINNSSEVTSKTAIAASGNKEEEECPNGGSPTPKPQPKNPRSGLGRDYSKPECKKSKLLRLERKKKKAEERGVDPKQINATSPAALKKNVEKSLEEFLAEADGMSDRVHNLKVVTVRSSQLSHEDEQLSWKVFLKYQLSVHLETMDEWSFDSYAQFLIHSPLQEVEGSVQCKYGYGSYHQQYWLDSQLIAVGVIDILPRCVSSVYFFYDPDYSHLSLGTYGSLREVGLAREICGTSRDMSSYYLGFYVHSCPKMRYKTGVRPAYLLCPELYTWQPVHLCLEKLDRAKYSRLDDTTSPGAMADPSVDQVLVLWKRTAMPYSRYRQKATRKNDLGEVTLYAKLVGNKCASRMLLYRD